MEKSLKTLKNLNADSLNKAPSKKKKGFILTYCVCVMAFVLILINGVMTLVEASGKGSASAQRNFNLKVEVYQVEEYLAAGNKEKATDIASSFALTLAEQRIDGGIAYTVKRAEKVALYLEIADDGRVLYRAYGEKSGGVK